MVRRKEKLHRTLRIEPLERREMLSASSPMEITEFAGKTFFTADDGIHGEELWVSDGTLAGTALVKDIRL